MKENAMQQSDFEKFKKLIVGTAGIYGQYLPQESIPIFFGDLLNYELSDIERAIELYRVDVQVNKLPTSGQIIYTILSMKKKPVRHADQEKSAPPEHFFEEVKNLIGQPADDEKKFEIVNPLNDTDMKKFEREFLSQIKLG